MNRRQSLALLVGGIPALKAQLPESSHPETQKLIIENEFVRVWDIHVPPGTFEPEHHHAHGVTIALSDYDNRTKSIPDGKVSGGHTKFGEVKWAEAVTHEATNTGSTEQRVVRIELKKETPSGVWPSTPDALDPLIVCKDTQTLIFENKLVRAIEERVPAGIAQPRHKHANSVTIALSKYDIETTSYPSGTLSKNHTDFGAVRWAEPVVHEARNIGSTEQRVVRIELK